MPFKIQDYYITTPVDTILQILRLDLQERGINRFEKIKRTGENVMTNCPFHSEGQEKRPSFGISEKGECHCFACGWASDSIDMFISAVYGHDDNGKFGREWIISRISSDMSVRSIDISFNRLLASKKEKNIVTEEELDSYRYIHPYMYKRHLNNAIIDEFDVGYDSSRRCLTFPVKNLSGDVVFVATRSVVGKFFTLPSNQDKPVYAAERFVSGKYSSAIICESILNALTCWKFGKPAVALMGTGSKNQIDILKRLPVRKYILALDPDAAGEKGLQRIRDSLKGSKILYRYPLPEGKDINDLDSAILDLKETLI